MQRYFIEDQVKIGDKITFSDEQSHHMLTVMRMAIDNQILVVDGSNRTYLSQLITDEHPAKAQVLEEKEEATELPLQVDIVCGLSKGDKLELITQKSTELGVNNIYPWAAKRSVVKWVGNKADKKIIRLQKIADEAAEQSHRQAQSQIGQLLSTVELVNLAATYDQVVIASEEAAKAGEMGNLAQTFQALEPGQKVLAVFGPEGGLDQTELDLFADLDEAQFCGLGPRILRTETAPLYFLAALSYEFELRR